MAHSKLVIDTNLKEIESLWMAKNSPPSPKLLVPRPVKWKKEESSINLSSVNSIDSGFVTDFEVEAAKGEDDADIEMVAALYFKDYEEIKPA